MASDVPDSLKDLIFRESGFQCAYCGHRDGLNLTCHHIESKEDKGETDYNNLIALCFNCQNRIHKTKTINSSEIRRIKRDLVEKFLTYPGVNALKLALKHKTGHVAAPPSTVEHLRERGLLELVEDVAYQKISEQSVVHMAVYLITADGKKLVEKWLRLEVF